MTLITLTPIVPGLNKPVGIDYHEPTGKVVISLNWSDGIPHNFELVDRSGAHTPFSTASGFTNEVKSPAYGVVLIKGVYRR